MPTYKSAPMIAKPTPPWRQSKRERRAHLSGIAAMRRVHDEREARRVEAARSPFDRNDIHVGPHAKAAERVTVGALVHVKTKKNPRTPSLRGGGLTGTPKSLAAEALELGFRVDAATIGDSVHVVIADAQARIAEAWWTAGRFGGAKGWDAGLTMYRAHNVTTLRAALHALAPKVAS